MLDSRPARKIQRRPDGAPKKSGTWLRYVLLVFAVGLLVAAGFAFRRAQPVTLSPRQEMIQAAQIMVRRHVDAELQTTFAGDEETTVDPLADNKFMISGWVDLVTKAGRQDRQRFSLVLSKNFDDNWVGEQITVIP